jgi:hypothetical protein
MLFQSKGKVINYLLLVVKIGEGKYSSDETNDNSSMHVNKYTVWILTNLYWT